jgi:hypothetical protein
LLPAFTADGLLPEGDYPLTLDQLETSMLVTGPDPRSAGWDEVWRRQLVQNLRPVVGQLRSAGVQDIFIDGSFVTDKSYPHDIDGYSLCGFVDLVSGTLERRLNALVPGMWTFDVRRWQTAPGKGAKPPTWFRYNVELYWDYVDFPGGGSPVRMRGSKTVAQFFWETRDDRRRGIVRIVA